MHKKLGAFRGYFASSILKLYRDLADHSVNGEVKRYAHFFGPSIPAILYWVPLTIPFRNVNQSPPKHYVY